MTRLIREAGMVPGLWLEPEVVSVASPVARLLPADAFFQRDGELVIESGRLQLDLRHPAALSHIDGAVERLIADLGLGYLKFDYNMDVTQGTDVNADSPGDGQLGHQRALLDWVRDLMDRHPGLVIESCASGGQRMDAATLSVHPVQSTSDNQDPLFTAAIAAAAPTAVTPEQGAVWAYPDPSWTDERIVFSLASALLGPNTPRAGGSISFPRLRWGSFRKAFSRTGRRVGASRMHCLSGRSGCRDGTTPSSPSGCVMAKENSSPSGVDPVPRRCACP